MQLTIPSSSEGEKPIIERHNDGLNKNINELNTNLNELNKNLNELNTNLNELNNNHLYDFALEFSLKTN